MTHVLVAVLVLGLVPLGLVGYATAQRQEQVATEQAFTRLDGIAEVQAARVDAMVRRDVELLEVIMGNAALVSDLAAVVDGTSMWSTDRARDRLANLVEVARAVRTATVVDASGRVVLSTEAEPEAIPTAALVDLGAEMPDAVIGESYVSPRDGEVFLLCSPIRPDGVTTGVLALTVSLDELAALATDYAGLGSTGETSIARRGPDGSAQFLAPLRFAGDGVSFIERSVPASAAQAPIIRAINGMEGWFTDSVDYRGEPVYAVTRSLEQPGFAVVVKMDRLEALAAVVDFRNQLRWVLMVGAIVLGVLAVGAARFLTRPIADLHATTKAIADGDLVRRAVESGPREIRSLARSVNRMTDQLVERISSESAQRVVMERTNRLLQQTEERSRVIVETSTEGILAVDTDGVILECNPAAAGLLEADGRPARGRRLTSLLAEGSGRDVLDAHFAHGGRGAIHDVDAVLHVGTDPTAVSLSVAEIVHRDRRFSTVWMRDISHRVAFERELRRRATHDELTGLANRALLGDALERAVARARRTGSPLALLFCDLDRFKMINDSRGHGSGDRLLRAVAMSIRQTVRPADLVCRFGGDEFVVLLEDLRTPADAEAIAGQIHGALARPFEIDGEHAHVTISIGIVTSYGWETGEELLANADVAMYQAKQAGRARHHVYDAALGADATERFEVESALRRAIDHQELDLAYQPLVELPAGRPTAVEALLRWHPAGRGSVEPAVFIPIAEEAGLIAELGAWVLDRATADVARWNDEHPDQALDLAVNVSAKQLASDDFVDQVAGALGRAGLAPARLTLEITESVVLERWAEAIRMLHRLKDLGVRLSVDDFGTGYSSLTYLSLLPVDELKIDRTFVQNLEAGGDDVTIIATIMSMARSLELGVVAEGIETAHQADRIVDLGCTRAQGFHFARPDELAVALGAAPQRTVRGTGLRLRLAASVGR